jgi:hypothetical protein
VRSAAPGCRSKQKSRHRLRLLGRPHWPRGRRSVDLAGPPVRGFPNHRAANTCNGEAQKPRGADARGYSIEWQWSEFAYVCSTTHPGSIPKGEWDLARRSPSRLTGLGATRRREDSPRGPEQLLGLRHEVELPSTAKEPPVRSSDKRGRGSGPPSYLWPGFRRGPRLLGTRGSRPAGFCASSRSSPTLTIEEAALAAASLVALTGGAYEEARSTLRAMAKRGRSRAVRERRQVEAAQSRPYAEWPRSRAGGLTCTTG